MSQESNSAPLITVLSDRLTLDGSLGEVAMSATTDYIFQQAVYAPYYTVSGSTSDTFDASDYPLYLIDIPCLTEGGNLTACENACLDAESLFGNWETLWSCLMLASLSVAAKDSESVNEEVNNEISNVIVRLGAEHPKVDISAFNGAQVYNRTLICMRASCDQDSMGDCDTSPKGKETLGFPGNGNWSLLNDAYCDGVDWTINVDVAGPGVIMSYMLQSLLAIYAWIVLALLTCKDEVEFLTDALEHWTTFRRGSRSLAFLDRIKDSNMTHSTVAFLNEFHETQCFFILAISIAVIYAQSQTAGFNSADNWKSLVVNQDILSSLGLAGVQPLILTQLTLHRMAEVSVYSLICSTLAVIMAGISMPKPQGFDATRVHEMFKDKQGINQCGGHPSLRTFCTDTVDPGFSQTDVFPWLIVLGVLWCMKLWPIICEARERGRESSSKDLDNEAEDPAPTSRQATYWKWARLIAKWAIHLAFIVVRLMLVGCIIVALPTIPTPTDGKQDAFKYVGAVGTDNAWNVGQVVAMLVWVPILAKYFYTILFGIERGFAVRLSSAFIVLRKSPREAGSGTQNGPRERRDSASAPLVPLVEEVDVIETDPLKIVPGPRRETV